MEGTLSGKLEKGLPTNPPIVAFSISSRSPSPAVLTKPLDLDRRLLRLEVAGFGEVGKAGFDRVVVELDHLAAAFADGKGCQAVAVAVLVRVGAGDEGVDAFQPVHDAEFEQLFERAIDLQRRAKTVIAQLVEDRVGAERAFGVGKRVEDQGLVLGQLRSVHR